MAENWLTKAEAAQALGVDERTIERKARAGKLGSQGKPGFPTLYNPADVRALASGGQPTHRGALETAVQDSAGNGNGALAPRRAARSAVEQLADAMLDRLGLGPTGSDSIGPTGPTDPTLFLSVKEASAMSGLTQAYLVRQIKSEKLPAVRDRGWRIRRRDLEAL